LLKISLQLADSTQAEIKVKKFILAVFPTRQITWSTTVDRCLVRFAKKASVVTDFVKIETHIIVFISADS
jgi:hypothetical protein